jgi:hypothetical protein
MPGKKKVRRFRAATAVKSAARNVIGTPPAVRREEGTKRSKKEKHKPTMGKLLSKADDI